MSRAANEASASYEKDELKLTRISSHLSVSVSTVFLCLTLYAVTVKIPPSYPLRPVELDFTRRLGSTPSRFLAKAVSFFCLLIGHSVAEGLWRKWLLSITTLMSTQDGTILEAVSHYDGFYPQRLLTIFSRLPLERFRFCSGNSTSTTISREWKYAPSAIPSSMPRIIRCLAFAARLAAIASITRAWYARPFYRFQHRFLTPTQYTWFQSSHKSNCPLYVLLVELVFRLVDGFRCQTPFIFERSPAE